MTLDDTDLPVDRIVRVRTPLVFQVFHSIFLSFYGVLLDLLLVSALVILISITVFEYSSSYFILSIVAAAVVLVVFLIPVALLSYETVLTQFVEVEDTAIVVKILRKQLGKNRRIKDMFSAMSFRRGAGVHPGPISLHDDSNNRLSVLHARAPAFEPQPLAVSSTVNLKTGYLSVENMSPNKVQEYYDKRTEEVPTGVVDLNKLAGDPLREMNLQSREGTGLSVVLPQSPTPAGLRIKLSPLKLSPNRGKLLEASPKQTFPYKLDKFKAKSRSYCKDFPGRKGYCLEDEQARENVKRYKDYRIKRKFRGNGKDIIPVYDLGPGFSDVRTIDAAQEASKSYFTHESIAGEGLRRRNRSSLGRPVSSPPGSMVDRSIEVGESAQVVQHIWKQIDRSKASPEEEEDNFIINAFSRNDSRRKEDIFKEKIPLFY
jgi:hypothetical protein